MSSIGAKLNITPRKSFLLREMGLNYCRIVTMMRYSCGICQQEETAQRQNNITVMKRIILQRKTVQQISACLEDYHGTQASVISTIQRKLQEVDLRAYQARKECSLLSFSQVKVQHSFFSYQVESNICEFIIMIHLALTASENSLLTFSIVVS